MFRPFANSSCPHAVWLSTLALASVLSACGSSPSKETDSDPVASTQVEQSGERKSRRRGDDKDAAAQVLPPDPSLSPPPIPPEATQQFERALTLLSAGDLEPAATELQRLADAYPDYSGPLVNLGIVHLKSGKYAEAEKTLLAATERGEPSAAAFNQLGIAYRQQGRFKEADAAYSRALAIDPDYALAHLNLGVLCDMYLDDPQRALTAYDSYLRLAPNPDARVSNWAKELRARLGIAEPRTPEPAARAPDSPPDSSPDPSPTASVPGELQ